jgi:hypothetical protein
LFSPPPVLPQQVFYFIYTSTHLFKSNEEAQRLAGSDKDIKQRVHEHVPNPAARDAILALLQQNPRLRSLHKAQERLQPAGARTSLALRTHQQVQSTHQQVQSQTARLDDLKQDVREVRRDLARLRTDWQGSARGLLAKLDQMESAGASRAHTVLMRLSCDRIAQSLEAEQLQQLLEENQKLQQANKGQEAKVLEEAAKRLDAVLSQVESKLEQLSERIEDSVGALRASLSERAPGSSSEGSKKLDAILERLDEQQLRSELTETLLEELAVKLEEMQQAGDQAEPSPELLGRLQELLDGQARLGKQLEEGFDKVKATVAAAAKSLKEVGGERAGSLLEALERVGKGQHAMDERGMQQVVERLQGLEALVSKSGEEREQGLAALEAQLSAVLLKMDKMSAVAANSRELQKLTASQVVLQNVMVGVGIQRLGAVGKLRRSYEEHREAVNEAMGKLAGFAEEHLGVEGAQQLAEALELKGLTLIESRESKFSPYTPVQGFRLASDQKQPKDYLITVNVAENKAALGLRGSSHLKRIQLHPESISDGGSNIIFKVEGKKYTKDASTMEWAKRKMEGKDKTEWYRKPFMASVVTSDPSQEAGSHAALGRMLEVQLRFQLPANLKSLCACTVLRLQLVLDLQDGGETLIDVEMPLYLHVHRDTKAARAKDAALSLKARYDALPPWAQELIKGGATLLVRLV